MGERLTKRDIEKIEEEIEHRKLVIRKEAIEAVKEARAQGDLSENFEYKAAKRERGRNEGRIKYLEKMIKTCTVIEDNTASDEVGLGKVVTVNFIEDDFCVDYTIVTTMEMDVVNNKISIECPLGKEIYGKKVGQEVEIDSPDGKYMVRIEAIKNL